MLIEFLLEGLQEQGMSSLAGCGTCASSATVTTTARAVIARENMSSGKSASKIRSAWQAPRALAPFQGTQ